MVDEPFMQDPELTGDSGQSGTRRLAGIVLWCLPYVAAIVFVHVWRGLGLIRATGGSGITFTVCALVMLVITALRHTVFARDAREVGTAARTVISVVLLVMATVFARYALEIPWNEHFSEIEAAHLWLELGLIALVLVVLWFACGRRGALPAVGVAAFGLLGVAQYFIRMFRGSAILPMDLAALDTAMAVGGSYRYVLDGNALLGIGLALAGVCVCSLMVGPEPADKERMPARILGNVAGFAVATAVLAGLCTIPDFRADFGVDMAYWNTLLHYEECGFLPSFVTSVQDLDIEVPSGYSESGAEALEAELAARYESERGASEERQAAVAQFEEQRPTIVVIMDETFADLSQLNGEAWGYAGPDFVCNRLLYSPGLVAYGNLGVSVLGGGTCNTEFEFLTGISMGMVGAGKYPYQFYDLTGVQSLPRQLSELGYPVVGMHPSKPNNWNRANAFEQLGFDRFVSEAAFEGRILCHAGISDRANFDVILETLEDYQSPQFIFNVTIQNHSPYTLNLFPEVPDYAPERLSEDLCAELNEYLTCIEESDHAIEGFLVALEQLDRPVVVVYFGDHHPGFSAPLNDALYPEEDPTSIEHVERIQQTPYFVWANYAVGGTQGQYVEPENVGCDMLASLVLERIGAPLTTFQQAQLVLHEDVALVNAAGWQDGEGTWHEHEDVSPEYEQLMQIEYLEFAEHI